MLILHYTGMRSAAEAQARLCDPLARVSAHYLVDEDGRTERLVEERHRAWHAGVSWWRGRANLNDWSIGIELVNPGHEWGYRSFPEAQIDACIELCRGILGRWPIPARHVLGHSDVAPMRKADPGELFPWQRLAAEGIGLWPEVGFEAASDGMAALATFGYPVDQTPEPEALIRSFQRHFRPMKVDGALDEQDLRQLAGLVALI
ncbi:MAG: N-acetylmuramoyl-L-alanine amidase [Geminicoccaceae bacterium]